jgi:hypothetical protein
MYAINLVWLGVELSVILIVPVVVYIIAPKVMRAVIEGFIAWDKRNTAKMVAKASEKLAA